MAGVLLRCGAGKWILKDAGRGTLSVRQPESTFWKYRKMDLVPDDYV